MADGQQNQGRQQFNSNEYYLKEQAARMLSAIQKGYNENFPSQVSMDNSQQSTNQQQSVYMNHHTSQQQQEHHMQQQMQPHGQSQMQDSSMHSQVQHQQQQQQLQQQLQQVQQAQQQFQQMQQLAQMQQQFQQQYVPGNSAGVVNAVVSPQAFRPSRRGRKPIDKKKRKRHTNVKRPCTAYLHFVSKYRETLKEAGEVVPKAKIITQACAEKWRNMSDIEKEPFWELYRRDRERWQKDKALEKKPRDPNKPKRPLSAYFLFLAYFRKHYLVKSDPAKEITKKAGEAWNNLSDQEKAPYYRDAQVIRGKWEKDLEAYKQSTSLGVPGHKNGPLCRIPSMQSDPDQLDIGSDDTDFGGSPPAEDSLSHINADMLQGTNLMGVPGRQNIEPAPQTPSPVTDGMPSADTSSASYPGYSHLMVDSHSPNIEFPGR